MSKVVDERVVEMRFDNKDFEKNVSTTMSTLEKLKAKLKFPGTVKGLDSVSKAAKNVDFSGMQKGIETVNARFSALQVVGMTALSNLTTAAMQAGSSLVKSFTTDPIVSGFKEYELQMNSIQTILANTKSKGTTMDDVTKALDELNEYADLTIYNFAEMTKNIGTFTAAGVDLDTSVGAIKGIANLGAMSSSTASQVNSAMYQLSQALATGRVSLMDWNSVVNAGMGGEQFQNALKRTAENMGKDVDGLIEKYGSFRESLTMGGWLTADILNETLNQIGGAYDEAELRAKGYSEENIKAILDLAQTATDAATEVKTFTQLMDTLKEAAGSGWAKTWQLIFGDFEEAKEFFSGLHEKLEPIVTGPIDAMNSVIEKAMGGGESRWGEFETKLKSAGVSMDDFQKSLTKVSLAKGIDLDKLIADYGSLEKAMASGQITSDMVSQSLKDLASSTDNASASTKELAEWQKVVDDVWLGTYGNIDTGRMEKLAKAGWEYAEVQKLVNRTVDGHRLTLEDLSAAQIESMGYTKEQAQALADLAKQASESGGDINTLINDILAPKRSGRELFLEGLENVLTAILRPLQAVGKAFGDVFGMNADGLYDLIEGFNKFSKAIIISEDDAENLTRTMRGVFSIVHLVATAAGKTFVAAFEIADSILGIFGTNLLEVTGFIGDAIYAFDQWVTSGNVFNDLITLIGEGLSVLIGPLGSFFSGFSEFPIIKNASTAVQGFFETVMDYFGSFADLDPGEVIAKIVEDFKDGFNKLKSLKWEDVLKGLTDLGEKIREAFEDVVEKIKEVGPDIIEGLQNGLSDGFDKVVQFMKDLGSKIIEAVCAILGIHSPSTVFFDIGKDIIEGLCNGIMYVSDKVTETLSAIIEDIKTLMEGVDWGAVLTVGAGVGSFIVLYQFTDALQGFATAAKQVTAPAQSAASVMNSVKTTIDGFNERVFGKDTTSKGFQNIAQGVLILSQSIAILTGSVAVLSALDQGKMWGAVGAIAALAVIIGALAIALNKFANGGSEFAALKLNTVLLSLAGSFVLMAVAAKIIDGISWEGLGKAAAGLIVFAGVVAALVVVTKYGGNIDGAANILSKIGIAFLLLAATAKILGTMNEGEIQNAQAMLVTFTTVVASLIAVTNFAKHADKASSFIAKIGIAFLLLAATAKILGTMNEGEMSNAAKMLATFAGVVAVLILITNLGSSAIDSVTDFIGKVGLAFLALAVAARLMGGMSDEQMIQAAKALVGFIVVIGLLVLITNIAPQGQIAKISGTLLAMSLAIGILAGIAVLLSYVKTENLVKGIAAISALVVLMGLLTAATHFAGGNEHTKSAFIGMAVAIGVIAASVAVLSLLDQSKVQSATACMAVLMGMFALIAKAGSNIQTAVGPIIAMGVILGLLAGSLYVLAGLPTESVLNSAIALSAVMAALAISLKLISGVEKVSTRALVAVGVLAVVLAGIAGVFLIMNQVDSEGILAKATALSLALLAVSAACAILSKIPSVAPMALVAVVVLTAVLAGIAGVFLLMNNVDPASAATNASALTMVLLGLSSALVVLSMVGAVAAAALAGIGVATVAVVAIGVLIAAVAAIAQNEGVVEAVNRAGELLGAVGNAIGQFVGGLVGGALEGISSSLPGVADNLSEFMIRLTPFITGLKMIDPSAQESITALTNMILGLTAGGLLDAITEFITGESSLTHFAEQLVPFGQAMMAYSNTVSGIDAEAVQASAIAGQALGELANNLPKEGGLAQAIFGESTDLGEFGTQLVQFGVALKAYSVAISGIDTEAIQNSATAGQALSQLASSLPKEGGLAQAIFGESTDLGEFGTQLVQFGIALKMYAASVSGLDIGSIQNSVAAGQALSDLSASLGDKDSVFGWLAGGNKQDLSGFGDQLSKFGGALQDYSESVSGVDFSQINTATRAVKNVVDLVADNLETDMSGIENIKKIKEVGTAIAAYSITVGLVDIGQIHNSITAVQELTTVVQGMVGLDTSGIATFKSAIAELSTIDFAGFAKNVSTGSSQMVTAGFDIVKNLAQGIQNGSEHVSSAIEKVMNRGVLAVKSAIPLYNTGGVDLGRNIATGISTTTGMIMSAVRSALAGGAGAIRGYYGSFRSAGSYIASGMAAGIRSGGSAVSRAARSIAQQAASAARAALDINSPSKVFRKIGKGIPEGFVQGIGMMGSVIDKTASDMAGRAIDATSTAMSLLDSLDFSDIDAQPVVAPVLDLSNVENGAGQINGMLSNLVPIDVLGQVSSINRSMNARLQNGGNTDVVDAIDRLRRNVNDLSRPTYNVNGITYDDGSAIAGAVSELVRATRIERRI